MFSEAAKVEIENELARAAAARAEGYEGRARVCARRAAGAAIREYHRWKGRSVLRANAYDLLVGMKEEPGLSPSSRQAVDLLLLRVDEEFRLPEEVDLLEEARRLVEELEQLVGES